jgi:cell division initiation protein
MRITPIDIQQQQFKSRLMGYDKAGVDQFLEIVAGELERLQRQNQDLQEELARNRSALTEMREREATLKETLLTTQKVTDELKANARREAELLLTDAELRAEKLMCNADERRLQLLDEIHEIRRQKIDFETSLRSLLEKHVRMLDLHVVAIGADQPESRMIEEPAAVRPTPPPDPPVETALPPAATAAADEPEFDLPPSRRGGQPPVP